MILAAFGWFVSLSMLHAHADQAGSGAGASAATKPPAVDRKCFRVLRNDGAEPKLPERWADLHGLIAAEPRAALLKRAAYIAILWGNPDGKAALNLWVKRPFPFKQWFTIVNSRQGMDHRLSVLELRQLLDWLNRFDIVRFRIPREMAYLGRPELDLSPDVYDYALRDPNALSVAKVDADYLRVLWDETNFRVSDFAPDAEARAGDDYWFVALDGSLKRVTSSFQVIPL